MKIWSLLLFICAYSLPIKAAAPATHILFAEIWMEKHETAGSSQQPLFLAGNLFPDIRYLETIDRDQTHEKGVSPDKIRKTVCPFKAGMLLHSLVDEKRKKFVKKSNIYSSLKKIPKNTRVLFLKLLEDEIYWEQIDRRQSQEALISVYPEEIQAGAESHVAAEWHQILIAYLDLPPSLQLKQLAKEGKGFLQADAKTIAAWSRVFTDYTTNPIFLTYAEELRHYLTKELQN